MDSGTHGQLIRVGLGNLWFLQVKYKIKFVGSKFTSLLGIIHKYLHRRCLIYRRIRSFRNTQHKQSRDFFLYIRPIFYFSFIPTWRVSSTMIAVFLCTWQFWWYAILRVTPSVFRITFFRTSPWWLRDCGLDLWFVFCSKLRICFGIHVGIVIW